jgi:hypothetical protein
MFDRSVIGHEELCSPFPVLRCVFAARFNRADRMEKDLTSAEEF